MISIKIVFPTNPKIILNDKVKKIPDPGTQYMTDWDNIFQNESEFSKALEILEEDALEVDFIDYEESIPKVFLKPSNG
ncbi:hypothetical protein DN752_21170 [Echinicola strongylocentroti]|uniref:Uncharacterized protein n=1 Tax=Echinicola strongylocentroti TaxID=1795355 RepID=A0A2Z4INI3_9BACT|nr:hypothetical protein [Echinicola strongylocentroti]AWW32455.1 hypothetical protein DN752_21170 [Echinicola strongylocentroti]